MSEVIQQFNLITKYEEITSRSNFVEKAIISKGDDVQNILSELVGFYFLKEKVKCGISSCGTKHQKGYIAILHDGKEIIIGHNCGKNYFGMSFDEKSTQFAHLRDNAKQYLRVKEAYQDLESMIINYNSILSSTGRMSFSNITNSVREFKNDVMGYWVHREIEKGVSNNGVISRIEFKSQDEMRAERVMKEFNGRSSYISEHKTVHVATISNWDVIADWYNAEKLRDWFDVVHREIKNPDSMQPEAVKKVYKKLVNYDSSLKDLQAYCLRGNKLFQAENLSKLIVLLDRESDRKAVELYVKKFL